jgi:ABC-type sugar transport system substrate-binding protein
MTQKRMTLAWAVGTLSAAGLLSVTMTVGGSAADFVKKSPLTLGYSIQSAQDPYWGGYVNGIKEEMKKNGFTDL